MNSRFNGIRLLLLISVVLIPGCTGTGSNPKAIEAGSKIVTSQSTSTQLETADVAASAQETPDPETLPAPTVTPTQQEQMSFGDMNACQQIFCVIEVQFPLSRPIEPPGRNTVERSYPYGSTQNGQREPHHGVEFINKAGVPVLAAADGTVIVAGTDENRTYASKRGFYGNLVIIHHRLPGISEPVFTLYGHLLTIGVSVGEQVSAGTEIGQVGLGGVAAGTHLHFEVRMGENTYTHTRNPELWLQPALSSDGRGYGTLAGKFVTSANALADIENIVLQSIEDQDAGKTYLRTYEEDGMAGKLPWKESFGLGDLPEGIYQFSFIYKRPEQITLQIVSGKLTYVTVTVK